MIAIVRFSYPCTLRIGPLSIFTVEEKSRHHIDTQLRREKRWHQVWVSRECALPILAFGATGWPEISLKQQKRRSLGGSSFCVSYREEK
jgi:hypothetical protein